AGTATGCESPGAGYVRSVTNGGGDCADNDATLNPATVWYLDADGDGFAATTQASCTSPGVGYTRTVLPVTDCADNSSVVYPGSRITITASNGGVPIPLTTTVTYGYSVTGSSNAVWNWTVTYYDGTTDQPISSKGGVVTSNLNGTITIKWPTDLPRVYKVRASYNVASCLASAEMYVAVYDPNAGFVTGGGWINSLQGSIRPNNSLGLSSEATGVANFGFVAKYKKGSSTVEGNTEFQFVDGNLNFRSSLLETGTLVIDRDKATYRGVGSINGVPGFKFTVIATDADILGLSKQDKFRIRIWDVNEELLYDNNVTALVGEEYNTGTQIGGGSIVIHQPAGKKSEAAIASAQVASINVAQRLTLKAYPNPAVSQFNISLESNNTRDAITLKVYNQLGQVVDVKRNLFSGQVVQVGAAYKQGTYFIEVTQGEQKQNLQVVKTN
ncbi:MAG TPA: T9SS type A sorting domain-containing protein, partial [Flavisolibacter sp.]|nr:T9SS type A sorting domain-containing protein [Flavisolibacter sp.]